MVAKQGARYRPHRLLELEGVVSLKDLGPWQVFDAIGTSGSIVGRPIAREKVYGLRHPERGERFACGTCGLVYGAVTTCMQHRYKEHPFRTSAAVEVAKPKPRPVVATSAPEQLVMEIDEAGLDVAAPAILKGMSAIVASRTHARQRVAELEAENTALRSQLAAIRQIVGGA
jgi:hypothetical protein